MPKSLNKAKAKQELDFNALKISKQRKVKPPKLYLSTISFKPK
jgi:hypothetical protein